jgi:hypothetical protein
MYKRCMRYDKLGGSGWEEFEVRAHACLMMMIDFTAYAARMYPIGSGSGREVFEVRTRTAALRCVLPCVRCVRGGSFRSLVRAPAAAGCAARGATSSATRGRSPRCGRARLRCAAC